MHGLGRKLRNNGYVWFPAPQAGSAMLFVLVLAIIGGLLMASLNLTSRMSTKKSGYRRQKVAALNIAEAGKETTIARMRGGSLVPDTGRSILFDTTAFGTGYYVVSCNTNNTLDTMCLWATGICENEMVTIEAIYAITLGAGTGGPAFDNGIFAGGDITWTGSGSCNCGSAPVFCNGYYGMSGSSNIYADVYACDGLSRTGSSDIYGNAFAPLVHQTGSGDISGTVTTGPVDTIEMPVIDLTPYYNHAAANGEVHGSSVHLTGSSDYVVPGGIMWVNGDFKRSGSGDFRGCVIATGDVDISGSGDYYKEEKYPLAVSINGELKCSGSGRYEGLLYAQNGDFTKSGSGDVVGSIICRGDFKKSGSWSVLSYVQSIPVPPGSSGNSNTVSLLSWKEI
ncbi:MAG: hypothetical protein OQK82_03535 [Candidatus Pacearchaeota archaeon]|nr:hypothetical protein [Candidatus Pacearchaeota archaeon]